MLRVFLSVACVSNVACVFAGRHMSLVSQNLNSSLLLINRSCLSTLSVTCLTTSRAGTKYMILLNMPPAERCWSFLHMPLETIYALNTHVSTNHSAAHGVESATSYHSD